jgi:hypothetical protein
MKQIRRIHSFPNLIPQAAFPSTTRCYDDADRFLTPWGAVTGALMLFWFIEIFPLTLGYYRFSFQMSPTISLIC